VVSETEIVHTKATKFTKREAEIMSKVYLGQTSRQVADSLKVSPRTVEYHLANIYRKLGVSNRIQAMHEATRLNLLDGNLLVR
jgi:DNA-binding CsgD family transcriptional regulator